MRATLSSLGILTLFLAGACANGEPSTGHVHDGSTTPVKDKPDMATSKPNNNNNDGDADMAGTPSTNDNPDLATTTTTNDSGITTLNIHYPVGTHSVTVRGSADGLNWTTGVATTKASDTLVTYTVTVAAGETLEWKPLLDDTMWSHGPNYKAQRGQTVDIYPHFVATNGTIDKPASLVAFQGDGIGSRDVWVYLPPSYKENTTATYPVLYMHDGDNLFPGSASCCGKWNVDSSLDAAIEGDGSIREIIVVGIFMGNDRNDVLTPTKDASEGFGGKGDLYLKMIVNKLKPAIDKLYRTQPGRGTTGLMGSSLGGLITLYAGIYYADTFGLVGGLSPSTWWDNTVLITDAGKMDMSKVHPDRIYLDSGIPSMPTTDAAKNDDNQDTKTLSDTFKAKGYTMPGNLDYITQLNATHSETYWAQRFPGAAAFLFGARP